MTKRKRSTKKSLASWAATRESRGVIEQAAADLKRGLKDTDCYPAARSKLGGRK